MNSRPDSESWVMANADELLAAALRLAAGNASQKDHRLVRKHLRRDGEKAIWLIAQTADGFPPAESALLKAGELDGEAVVKDLRNKVWTALTGLSRGHFCMNVVFDGAGYVEFGPTDLFGSTLRELARRMARADPSGPQIRTSLCRHCGASIEVKRRHQNGMPVRKYCSAKCKAAANYRTRLADAASANLAQTRA